MRHESLETNTTFHTPAPLISWRSALAGLAIALVTYIGALALAIAFGGIGLSDGATLQNAGIFAGVSIAVATILAAFAGAYFSVRVASTKVDVLGTMQGLLVGSVFMIFVLFQVFAAVGTLGQAAGQALGGAASAVGSGVAMGAENPAVREFAEDSFAGLNLRSEASVVASGTASRLMRGETESAKAYLANQAGLTMEQADERIAALNARAQELTIQAREATATALKATGWGLFMMTALGMIAASLGGLLASVMNTRATVDSTVTVTERRRSDFVQARA